MATAKNSQARSACSQQMQADSQRDDGEDGQREEPAAEDGPPSPRLTNRPRTRDFGRDGPPPRSMRRMSIRNSARKNRAGTP